MTEFWANCSFKSWCNCAALSRLLSSGSLVLLSPSNEDEGYFECTAVNDVGEERRVIEVILQGIDFEFSTISRQQRVIWVEWWICTLLFQSHHLSKTMSRQSQLWKCLLWYCLVTCKDALSPLWPGPRVEPNWVPEEEVIVSSPPVRYHVLKEL